MSSIRHDMTEIICSVLDDGKWHSIEEIRIEVEKKNVKFLSNRNYLSVILTGLKNDEKKIISDQQKKRMVSYEKCNISGGRERGTGENM